jgi:hypothetical protein
LQESAFRLSPALVRWLLTLLLSSAACRNIVGLQSVLRVPALGSSGLLKPSGSSSSLKGLTGGVCGNSSSGGSGSQHGSCWGLLLEYVKVRSGGSSRSSTYSGRRASSSCACGACVDAARQGQLQQLLLCVCQYAVGALAELEQVQAGTQSSSKWASESPQLQADAAYTHLHNSALEWVPVCHSYSLPHVPVCSNLLLAGWLTGTGHLQTDGQPLPPRLQ